MSLGGGKIPGANGFPTSEDLEEALRQDEALRGSPPRWRAYVESFLRAQAVAAVAATDLDRLARVLAMMSTLGQIDLE